jgi:hypothetical protein
MFAKTMVRGLLVAALVASAVAARAETEHFFQPVGMDTQLVFPHALVPGATGIDFSFSGAIDGGPRKDTDPPFPTPVSHILVIDFEWGPTETGPWSVSPDNVKSIPVEETSFFSTGVFHGPADAPFVAIHFYAGNLMTVSTMGLGFFTHDSVAVPEPSSLILLGMGALALGFCSWRRHSLMR